MSTVVAWVVAYPRRVPARQGMWFWLGCNQTTTYCELKRNITECAGYKHSKVELGCLCSAHAVQGLRAPLCRCCTGSTSGTESSSWSLLRAGDTLRESMIAVRGIFSWLALRGVLMHSEWLTRNCADHFKVCHSLRQAIPVWLNWCKTAFGSVFFFLWFLGLQFSDAVCGECSSSC